MTTTRNTVEIAAPASAVYELASATERWPEILPHYRYVRVLERRGATRLVAMSAWQDVFPLRWVAEQTNDPATPHIAFRHVRGWTRGMDVEWIFEPFVGGTRVTIEHRLRFLFPIASEWLGKHLVSDYFIHGVAAKTLARVKVLAEARA
ncbi:MAG TPA: SRPBCC family protein [Candidatus Elarobacter sp.]|jgi:ribosome-associated toxin RatA of RatAB toxin-antitoxin module|nr:SRPBCC family protein [Candidatus Elarobacter sp.]